MNAGIVLDINTVMQLVNIGVVIAGGLFFIAKLDKKLSVVYTIQEGFNKRLEKIDNDLEKLSTVTIDMARQSERMNATDNRITLLAARLDEHVFKDRNSRSQRNKG